MNPDKREYFHTSIENLLEFLRKNRARPSSPENFRTVLYAEFNKAGEKTQE